MDFAEFAIAQGGAKFCSLKATSSTYPAGEADLKPAPMHSPLTLETDIYWFERWDRLYSSYGGAL